jgi:hypothetical protein
VDSNSRGKFHFSPKTDAIIEKRHVVRNRGPGRLFTLASPSAWVFVVCVNSNTLVYIFSEADTVIKIRCVVRNRASSSFFSIVSPLGWIFQELK